MSAVATYMPKAYYAFNIDVFQCSCFQHSCFNIVAFQYISFQYNCIEISCQHECFSTYIVSGLPCIGNGVILEPKISLLESEGIDKLDFVPPPLPQVALLDGDRWMENTPPSCHVKGNCNEFIIINEVNNNSGLINNSR